MLFVSVPVIQDRAEANETVLNTRMITRSQLRATVLMRRHDGAALL